MNDWRPGALIVHIFILIVLTWGGAVLWMWTRQEHYLFLPNHDDPLPEFERFRRDRTVNRFHHQGWFLDKGADKTVIYHGGNAEDLASHCETFWNGLDCNALFFNYRGYGQSEGEPGEEAMVSDAIALYDLFREESGTPPENLFLMGRSLGTGVAIQVAAARPAAGLILTTPYESIAAIARYQYPWLPIERMLRHPFRAIDHAPNIDIPALVLLAEDDQVIPTKSGRKLAKALGGGKKIFTLPAGHNDIHHHPDYFKTINEFVQQTP